MASKNTLLNSGSLRLETAPDGFRLEDKYRSGLLLRAQGSPPGLPVIDGKRLEGHQTEVAPRPEGGIEWRVALAAGMPVASLSIIAIPVTDESAIDFQVRFEAVRGCQINGIDIFPPGTQLNFHDAVNFRNRHHVTATWPDMPLAESFSTGTFSDDWQFAPHPAAMLLRRNTIGLFAGVLDPACDFGMILEVKKNAVKQWFVDYGASPHGLTLKGGSFFEGPRVRISLSHDKTVEEIFSGFGRMLVEEGILPYTPFRPRHEWWSEPIYCTWTDQCYEAVVTPPESLAEQTAEMSAPPIRVLNERMVRDAVAVIQRENLPFSTILLDEGWNIARGEWAPHPERFPDFRGLVDDLHRMGFKVMVWWNWAEIDRTANADPRHLCGDGWLNRHGSRVRDYSNPRTRDEYLRPLFERLFSSGPGCFDIDGIKTDFLADKVHPEMPLHDSSWRGEENYIVRVTEFFHREMCRHKPDALHMGCAGNYRLVPFMELNRTYDVHSSNWLEHEARARMLQCTAPGVTVSYDMMTVTENVGEWFASARKMGAAVQVGNVLHVKDDMFSTPRPADAAYWEMLGLELQVSRD